MRGWAAALASRSAAQGERCHSEPTEPVAPSEGRETEECGADFGYVRCTELRGHDTPFGRYRLHYNRATFGPATARHALRMGSAPPVHDADCTCSVFEPAAAQPIDTDPAPGVGQGTPIKLRMDGSPAITAQEVIDLRALIDESTTARLMLSGKLRATSEALADLRTGSAELLRGHDRHDLRASLWDRLREVLSSGEVGS